MFIDNSNKAVLLIGASYSAVPLAKLIKESGFKLLILTGKPEEPATYFAEQVIEVDYSNHEKSMQELKKYKFDFVVPTCNDASYLLGAKIANAYGLPGFDIYETCLLISSKNQFRQLTSSLGIPAPKRIDLEDLAEDSFDYPVIMKPNHSFSGRGISVIRSHSEIARSVEKAQENSTDNKFATESYIEGSLHSVSGFIREQEIEIQFFVDEFCTVYPFQVNNSNFPSILNEEIKDKVTTHLKALISTIKFTDGLVHLQFMVRDNEVFFIELMRRCPGDLFGHLFQFSMGFDYYSAYVSPFLEYRLPLDIRRPPVRNFYIARATESSMESRIFLSISANSSNTTLFPIAKSGDYVPPAPFGKTAIAFFEFKDNAELHANRPNFDQYLSICSIRTGE